MSIKIAFVGMAEGWELGNPNEILSLFFRAKFYEKIYFVNNLKNIEVLFWDFRQNVDILGTKILKILFWLKIRTISDVFF